MYTHLLYFRSGAHSMEIQMCIYVYYTVVLVPSNTLRSYFGNLKNVCVFILYFHSGAHS